MYFSTKVNKIVNIHLQTIFIASATADIVLNHLLESLKTKNISIANIVSVGSDGPNVNKSILRKINAHLIDLRKYGLVEIGTCCIHKIHKIHNSFTAGMRIFGENVSDLAKFLFYYFESPARREKYTKLKFLKHLEVCWCSLGASAK
jgi:restriction endonuclease S subunit